MNRNVESHFAELPKVDIQRSIFDRSTDHKTSFNVGELIPFFVDEVLPGDTFNVETSVVVRLQTLLTPIMDNAYLDTYYYYVRDLNIWDHTREFFGENTTGAWIPQVSYNIPVINAPSGGWNVGTLADYFGIPTGKYIIGINALPFRAYASIVDNWFLDQNVQQPLSWSKGDSAVTGSNGSNYITDVPLGGKPFVAAKYHDYFTSCLPAPQKSLPISVFGNQIGGSGAALESLVPVYTTSASHGGGSQFQALKMVPNNSPTTERLLASTGNSVGTSLDIGNSSSTLRWQPINLWADVGAMELSINQLRLAFQLQKFAEKNARAGSRYREVIKEHFGVTTEDGIMHIPEYLGGHRFPLSIHQVANQSQGVNDFLGDLGAMSMTADVHSDFVKSFSTHGYVIGVAVVRYDHSYPQGLERMWSRSSIRDFYWPVFANIGEQPVLKKEIYCEDATVDTTGVNDTVFGYQEAWAEYRYKPNRVSGEMRPGVTNSLATWHLADNYNTWPSLSASWIAEDKSNVDRVLAVQSSTSNQVFCDFYVKNRCTRCMPMYSIPGLIDHH